MAPPRGQFVWYDLVTTDPKSAPAFYNQVAGWGTADFDNVPGYTMFTSNGEPGGGYVKTGEGEMGDGPPHWLPYVAVLNVDDTASLVKDLGGKVLVGPSDIPNTGRFAIIADPQGAALAIFTSASPQEAADVPPRPGKFSWNELSTRDHVAALEFYKKIFGWEKLGEFDMGEAGFYAEFGRNGKQYGGMMTAMPGMPVAWLPYIMVDDADKAVERATAAGASTILPPMDVPGGDRVSVIRDPQGAAVGIHSKSH